MEIYTAASDASKECFLYINKSNFILNGMHQLKHKIPQATLLPLLNFRIRMQYRNDGKTFEQNGSNERSYR